MLSEKRLLKSSNSNCECLQFNQSIVPPIHNSFSNDKPNKKTQCGLGFFLIQIQFDQSQLLIVAAFVLVFYIVIRAKYRYLSSSTTKALFYSFEEEKWADMDIDKQPTHKTQGAIEFDFFLPFVLFTCYIETYQNQNFSLYSYIVCIDYGFVCFVSLSLSSIELSMVVSKSFGGDSVSNVHLMPLN